MDFITQYLAEVVEITERLDVGSIERLVALRVALRQRGGRLFILGVGGGAGHASHAVNDFRKLAGIEAYAPPDNVSELTARINDVAGPRSLPTGSARAGCRRRTWCSSSPLVAAT